MERGSGFSEGSGVAGGIAGATAAFFLLLPILLVVLLYLFFTVLAMTKGTDLRAETLNLPLWLAGVAVLTATLVVLLFAGITILGRSLTPRKRRDA